MMIEHYIEIFMLTGGITLYPDEITSTWQIYGRSNDAFMSPLLFNKSLEETGISFEVKGSLGSAPGGAWVRFEKSDVCV